MATNRFPLIDGSLLRAVQAQQKEMKALHRFLELAREVYELERAAVGEPKSKWAEEFEGAVAKLEAAKKEYQ
jgi:hypothetical protein